MHNELPSISGERETAVSMLVVVVMVVLIWMIGRAFRNSLLSK